MGWPPLWIAGCGVRGAVQKIFDFFFEFLKKFNAKKVASILNSRRKSPVGKKCNRAVDFVICSTFRSEASWLADDSLTWRQLRSGKASSNFDQRWFSTSPRVFGGSFQRVRPQILDNFSRSLPEALRLQFPAGLSALPNQEVIWCFRLPRS